MGGRVVSDEEDEVAEEDDARVVDGDAIEDDDERVRMDDDDEEEEEEEDGQDEYEKDGFIVDDDEEEEAQGEEEEDREESDEERHKKRKRKKRESEKQYVLDEDDYELLQDNNITGFHRPKPGSKKFKRLKKAGRDAEEERSGFSDEEESDKNGRGGRTAEEKLKRSLFGDDEAAPLEDIAEEEEQVEEEEDADIGEEDEMADFIVDEEDVDENGAPMRRKKTKKKKSRQVLGVSSSALQEAHEIFGDVDELLALRKQDLARGSSDMMGWGEKRLEDEFEPLILEEKYMTPKDDIMRETDVPERIQLSEEITGHPPVDDKSIEEESAWIYNQITTGGASPMFGENQVTKEINKEDIGNVLGMLHVQKLDIPFIAMYRKELCLSLLEDTNQGTPENDETDDPGRIPELRWHKALWAVQNLDRKWLLLRKRKIALEVYYEKRFEEEARRVDDETRLALIRQLYKSIIDALKDAKSEREVDDVDMKFNLNFPPGEVDVDEGQFKRPKRKSLYSICCKAGLWEVAKKFGFSSEQFGLRFSLERMRLDEPEDAKEAPDEVAANFTCAMFETPQDVLKGSRHMAAVEISCEPVVRKHVRGIYMDGAVVSTSPTLEGNLAIDSFHPLAGAKWLQNKPLSAFLDAQWLLIQKAEEEKLLRVTIKMPEEALKKLISEANDNYLSECVSKSAQLWNEQRRLILEDSFFNLILPSMEKEARALLTARAKNWLLMEYGKHLWGKVSVAPYQRPDTEEEDEASRKVMGCCWGPGKPATTFVMLDSAGELLDVLYAGSINVKSQGVNEKQRKNNDQQRLQNFMIDHQPHVVGVGAANMTCKTLKDEINEIIYNIVEHHPRQVGSRFGTAAVFGDESLPRLYENSRVSSDQLPGQPGIVKRAVALARYLQNPLAMVATLCGPGREILSWKLCPLEHFLTADEKYEMVEQIMVDVTNQVGIDINLAASHEWLCAPLQFVSGLGPRKASALQKALARAGSVFSRKEITMGVLRKKAFINAVGFLRVRRSGAAAASSHIIDLLDDTRIHPESYDLAKSMAKVVYSYDADEDVNEMDDDAEEMAIEHVREKPQVLKTLHIVKYAEDVENKLGTRKRETLYDIKMELLHGFQDWRTAFREPDQDEEFYMISGETDETISDGKIVQVTVRWVQEQRIFCSLDSGLRGIITVADDFSDNNEDAENVLERVHEGDVLTCKIKNIQKHRCQVYLTCKESELRKRSNKFTRDTYYKEDEINVQSEQDKAQKEKKLAKKHFRPRMIVHPRFQNVSCDEAIEFLSGKDPGESVIRPSSRGPSYLTLTIKVSDDCHADKEIIEGDKDHKDITSLLRLGKKLTIGVDTFEDLDEVMDRFVDPLVTHMRNMLAYRKFRKGTKAEIDDLLRAEKVENPMRIVYCFGISYEHPGAFILTYIRNSNPHHELVGVGPKGFRFRKRDFDDIDRLVSHFQRHIDERVHDSGPSMRSVAAVVPMRSPAIGGSSGGGSVGGSWSVSPDGSDGWRNHTSSDRERSSTPGSRMGGRFDHRNSSGARDGHPSGLPRPFERGHGRGRGNPRNEGQDTGYSSGRWGSGSRDDDLSSFPGAKIQNSPGKERFPGGWVGGNGDSGTGGWANGGNGGWGSSREGAGTGGNWGGSSNLGGSGDRGSSGGWSGGGGGGGGGSDRGNWGGGVDRDTGRGSSSGGKWGDLGNNDGGTDAGGPRGGPDGLDPNTNNVRSSGWNGSEKLVTADKGSSGGGSGSRSGGGGW